MSEAPARSIFLALASLAVVWVLLMPLGSGPDEQSHLTRAGAAIRLEWSPSNTYDLPDRYQVAEAGCYAFQPAVPATCAFTPEHVGATLPLSTNAGSYPLGGHLWYGLFTALPVLDPVWWARLGGAAAAVALIGWSLVRLHRRSPARAAAVLVGVTPMAWSTFGVVNPSAPAIGGAVALWAGLLTPDDGDGRRWDARWLTAIGWAALVLPRRDGLVWAVIALVIVLAYDGRSVVSWWRQLGRAPQAVIAVSTVAMLAWGITSDSRSSQMIVLAPLALVALEGWRWWWRHPVQTTGTRLGSAAAAFTVGLFATYALVSTRPDGWDTDLAIAIVMQTDENLIEAIGVLGWLDTVVPAFAVHAWVLAIGLLVAGALVAGSRRTAAWAAALAGTIVLTSWVLELVQGNDSGLYWQGRYSIPLLVGLPLLLAGPLERLERRGADLRVAVGVLGLLVLNVAAWAAARRFGVGVSGSLLPWRWDTPIQPVPPVLLLVAHAAASVWLARAVLAPSRASTDAG